MFFHPQRAFRPLGIFFFAIVGASIWGKEICRFAVGMSFVFGGGSRPPLVWKSSVLFKENHRNRLGKRQSRFFAQKKFFRKIFQLPQKRLDKDNTS